MPNTNPSPTEAGEVLRRAILSIENLETEKAQIAGYISDAFKMLKEEGFDTKAVRQVLKLRKMEREEREELDALVTTYLHAVEGNAAAA